MNNLVLKETMQETIHVKDIESKKEKDTTPPRVNGFQNPFSREQIISYWFWGYFNISFYMITLLYNEYFIINGALHFVNLLLSIIITIEAYKATKANVIDIWVHRRGFPVRQISPRNYEEIYKKSIIQDELLYCFYCDSYVSKNAKHCRQCNRCTDGFDHHCRWFNNCVSKLNYKSFFICLTTLEMYLIYQMCVLVMCLLTDIIDVSKHILAEYLSLWVIKSMIILHLILDLIVFIVMTQLFVFHLWLIFHNITTYDYVLGNHKEIIKQNKKNGKRIKKFCHHNIIPSDNIHKKSDKKATIKKYSVQNQQNKIVPDTSYNKREINSTQINLSKQQ